MLRYRTALPSEREQYLSFANMVFSLSGRKHDFAALLPKVYGPHADCAEMQYLAVDDEKGIRGLIATLPGVWHVGDETLKTGYIGTVSVHPDARGEGHMKKLMQLNMGRMLQNGTDIAMLGGQRQRYSYFGYEPGGLSMRLTFSRRMARHALADADVDGLRFEPILPGSLPEAQAAALHRTQAAYFDRERGGFATVARSYGGTAYAVLQGDVFLGLVVCGQDPARVAEIQAVSLEAYDQIIKGWLERCSADCFTLDAPGWNVPLLNHLWNYAEDMRAGVCAQFSILRYARVLQALLRLKALYTPLEDGRAELEADGQPFTIVVENGRASVTSGAQRPIVLNHREAQRIFLDPFYRDVQKRLPESWFPLPLYVSTPDDF